MSKTPPRQGPRKPKQRRGWKLLPTLMAGILVVSILWSYQGMYWGAQIILEQNQQQTQSNADSHTSTNLLVPPQHKNPTSNVGIQSRQQHNHHQQQQHTNTTITTRGGGGSPPPKSFFSACLLIKDDNEILNEWIAYHYHVLNLRTLVVAVDPSSTTSPTRILEQWQALFDDLQVLQWNDEDYMPDYFLRNEYDKLPMLVPHSTNTSVWHSSSHGNNNHTLQDIQADLDRINRHRFRQVTFVSRCFQHLKKPKKSQQRQHIWTLHIDTDEYVVINPRLRQRGSKAVPGVDLPPVPTAGSLAQFQQDMLRVWPKRLDKTCWTMPSLLFGATDNTSLPILPGWNRSRFETLRWTYHAGFDQPTLSGMPKTMIDVSTLPDDHPIFTSQRIFSVHQPLESSYSSTTTRHKQTCRRVGMTGEDQWKAVKLFPLSIQHYVGSAERYFSRPNDARRNPTIYQEKSKVQGGVDEDLWIQGWISSFVDTFGWEAARTVLQDYTTTS